MEESERKVVTGEDVRSAALKYRRSRRSNPKIYGAYVNTWKGRHCLAAQIILDLGGRLPLEGEPGNLGGVGVVLPDSGLICDNLATLLLLRLQAKADQQINKRGCAWSRAVREVLLEAGLDS